VVLNENSVVWSFGCMLAESFLNRPLFVGSGSDEAANNIAGVRFFFFNLFFIFFF
jgi:hypothetical protein